LPRRVALVFGGPAVTGAVDEGETYEQAIIREAEEELGLADINLEYRRKIYQQAPRRMWMSVYFLRYNGSIDELTIQKEEVAQVRWVEKPILRASLRKSPR
jgi:NADH pyrophosphatase NudC (nudix superfamily)